MTLAVSQRRSVAFIGSIDSNGMRSLRGTGFFVGVPAEALEQVHLYVATAGHVIPHGEEAFIRLRRLDEPLPKDEPLVESSLRGTVVDVSVPHWHRHWDADVAVGFLADADEQWAIGVVSTRDFVDVSKHSPALGDPVFFAGLLGRVESMGERHVPMLRGGIIGALGRISRCLNPAARCEPSAAI